MNNDYMEEKYLEWAYKRMGCLPVVLLCVALFFCGCKTIHETELIEVHDTLTIHHSDTVREYKQKTLYDTINIYTEKIITLSEKGDTIKEIHNYFEKERVIERDSSDFYRSALDSIKSAIISNMMKEKVVEKKPSLWSTWKWKLITLALLIALILAVLPYIKSIISRIKKP